MKVVYAERARRDISEIYEFIAAHNPAAAKRVESLIRITCERLADFPLAAAKTDETGVHRLPLVRYPYTIFYRFNSSLDRVEIARVIHGARIKNLQRLPEAD
jgi:toxin ParE1/3/4